MALVTRVLLLLLALPLAAVSTTASAQAPAAVVDELGVAGPQQVAGQEFVLAFSVREPSGRVLQEYLPAGQSLTGYHSMLLIDFAALPASPQQLASAKLKEIQLRRQQGDMLANGALMQAEAGEDAIVDFLLSATLPDGTEVVEWNGYRYRRSNGGVVLYGLSRRAYGDGIRDFLLELKGRRMDDIGAVAAWQPELRPR